MMYRWFIVVFGLLSISGLSQAVEPMSKDSEHAVIVHFFNYGSTDLQRLFALEEQLEQAIADAGVGEFDGNEIATDGSDGYLYMYGPDADRLFEVVRPVLESVDFTRGAQVVKRYGEPIHGVRETTVTIAP
jgi:hypothetical protein